MLSTCVAVPDIGARTIVWSKSRCALSRTALAWAYSGNFSSGKSGSPSSWLSVESRCCTASSACNCAETTAAIAVSRSACDPACELTSLGLRSTSRFLRSTFLLARSARVFERLEVGLELVEIAACCIELGLRLLQCQCKRLAVEREQFIAGIDVLTFADGDMRDLAGDVRRDQNLLRADISVVGRDVAPAGKIDAEADHNSERRQADEQNHAQPLAADAREQSGRCWRPGFSLRRWSWLPVPARSSGLFHS